MKRAISLILTLAMLLCAIPAASAEIITDGTETTDWMGQVGRNVTPEQKGTLTLTITEAVQDFSIKLDYVEEKWAAYTVDQLPVTKSWELTAGQNAYLVVRYNDWKTGADQPITYSVEFTPDPNAGPAFGVLENPKPITEEGTAQYKLAADRTEGYYYGWTVSATGYYSFSTASDTLLTVTCGDRTDTNYKNGIYSGFVHVYARTDQTILIHIQARETGKAVSGSLICEGNNRGSAIAGETLSLGVDEGYLWVPESTYICYGPRVQGRNVTLTGDLTGLTVANGSTYTDDDGDGVITFEAVEINDADDVAMMTFTNSTPQEKLIYFKFEYPVGTKFNPIPVSGFPFVTEAVPKLEVDPKTGSEYPSTVYYALTGASGGTLTVEDSNVRVVLVGDGVNYDSADAVSENGKATLTLPEVDQDVTLLVGFENTSKNNDKKYVVRVETDGTEPKPTEPQPTEPQPTEPEPTDPPKPVELAMGSNAVAVPATAAGVNAAFTAPEDGAYILSAAPGESNAYICINGKPVNLPHTLTLTKGQVVTLSVASLNMKVDTIDLELTKEIPPVTPAEETLTLTVGENPHTLEPNTNYTLRINLGELTAPVGTLTWEAPVAVTQNGKVITSPYDLTQYNPKARLLATVEEQTQVCFVITLPEEEKPQELILGSNDIKVPAGYAGTEVTFTAPEDGDYLLNTAPDETNAYICLVVDNTAEHVAMPYIMTLTAGQTVTFNVGTEDLQEDSVLLMLEQILPPVEEILTLVAGDNAVTLQPDIIYILRVELEDMAAPAGTLTWSGPVEVTMEGADVLSPYDLANYAPKPQMTAIVEAEATIHFVITPPEEEKLQELVLGTNAVAVPAGYEGKNVVFTAAEAGEYVLTAAPGERNAYVSLVVDNLVEHVRMPYTMILEAGQSVILNVSGANVQADTIDLVLAKFEEPEPTDPEPTDPEPTDPEPTEPEPTDPPKPVELAVGSNAVEVPATAAGVNAAFTAPEDGEYILAAAQDEKNAYICINGKPINLPHTLTVTEGQVITLSVASLNMKADTIDLVLTLVEEPEPTEPEPTKPEPTEPKPTDPPKPVELELGTNAVAVPAGYACAEAAFTAPQTGTYMLSAAEGEENAYVALMEGNLAVGVSLPHTMSLDAGDTVHFRIGAKNLAVDIIDLELILVEEPEPTDPEPTDPEPTDPEPTDPEPTDPEPTDPEPTDPPVQVELTVGSNAIQVPATFDGIPVPFKAPADGEYILSAAEGENNAYISLMEGDFARYVSLPYTFTAAKDQTVIFAVSSGNVKDDIIDLKLTLVEAPEPEPTDPEPTDPEITDMTLPLTVGENAVTLQPNTRYTLALTFDENPNGILSWDNGAITVTVNGNPVHSPLTIKNYDGSKVIVVTVESTAEILFVLTENKIVIPELTIGSNAVEVPGTFTGVDATFTAPETGKYVLAAAAGEANAYISLNGKHISLPYAFDLNRGQTITFGVSAHNVKADIIDLMLLRTCVHSPETMTMVQTAIAAGDHTYGQKALYTCPDCGGTFDAAGIPADREDSVIPPAHLDAMKDVAEVKPTVDTEGMQAHIYCGACGKYFLSEAEGLREVTRESLLIPALPAYFPGDVDGSGAVNILDVMMVIAHINGSAELEGSALLAADAAEDGVINIFDAMKLISLISGA